MELTDLLEVISRADFVIPLMMSCVVAFFSLIYIVKTGNSQQNEDRLEGKGSDKVLQSPTMESNIQSEAEMQDLLLDAQDVNMMKKVDDLDTKDPSAVKQYVQQLRTQSYKTNLSDIEKHKEEEAKRQQLAQIYALMNREKEKFGETSIGDLQDQMTLYG
ncbi:matrix-remodeling-associated protein 7-like [Hydractinia symbiolongicarpus]|uniref:matrix-remodeling-associated protein 7-like n=1 Tax=Hydractinia symbiolongicarpus TaxID=13093 RepID=UPI00254BDD12|nr:matrix-remodeling-associated protein 7-like [Hydractinia symbiolongicarpus]XP_057311800.1 matrix-remodeling-associated protein 7-like [Hydractinia symbiolongicarpus]XP_057311801.1 matrix-remodeling-associated protein 7-like [Hydractinia symbiolongicarpus]XP_057311802.1 matrix-remodeling-associated protein 7-like [Hydractinia symbiolongicarpus]